MCHRRSWNRRIIANWKSQPRRPDSNKRISGEPGVIQSVHAVILLLNDTYCERYESNQNDSLVDSTHGTWDGMGQF